MSVSRDASLVCQAYRVQVRIWRNLTPRSSRTLAASRYVLHLTSFTLVPRVALLPSQHPPPSSVLGWRWWWWPPRRGAVHYPVLQTWVCHATLKILSGPKLGCGMAKPRHPGRGGAVRLSRQTKHCGNVWTKGGLAPTVLIDLVIHWVCGRTGVRPSSSSAIYAYTAESCSFAPNASHRTQRQQSHHSLWSTTIAHKTACSGAVKSLAQFSSLHANLLAPLQRRRGHFEPPDCGPSTQGQRRSPVRVRADTRAGAPSFVSPCFALLTSLYVPLVPQCLRSSVPPFLRPSRPVIGQSLASGHGPVCTPAVQRSQRERARPGARCPSRGSRVDDHQR